MEELWCDDCGVHIGWMSGSAPHGWVQCDECREREEEEEDDKKIWLKEIFSMLR